MRAMGSIFLHRCQTKHYVGSGKNTVDIMETVTRLAKKRTELF